MERRAALRGKGASLVPLESGVGGSRADRPGPGPADSLGSCPEQPLKHNGSALRFLSRDGLKLKK